MSTLKTIAQEAVNRATGLDNNSILSSANLQATATSLVSTLADNRVPLFVNDTTMQTNGPHSGTNHNNNAINANSLLKANVIGTGTNEAHIPPLLGVAPLGPCPLKKEHQLQFQMMEASEYHLPEPMDSERVRKHLIRRPCQTPASYPQVIVSFTAQANPFRITNWQLFVFSSIDSITTFGYIWIFPTPFHGNTVSSSSSLSLARVVDVCTNTILSVFFADFLYSITWKEQRRNTWRQKRWRSKVGDSIQSTWCGSSDTKNRNLSMKIMSR